MLNNLKKVAEVLTAVGLITSLLSALLLSLTCEQSCSPRKTFCVYKNSPVARQHPGNPSIFNSQCSARCSKTFCKKTITTDSNIDDF